MEELEAELERRAPEDAQSAQPISLREIYGSPGDLRAVIFHGSERVMVREGDTLPGGVTIVTVGQDYIDLVRAGREIRLSLRG
jgi:type IV pilus biogenesis protein PilP